MEFYVKFHTFDILVLTLKISMIASVCNKKLAIMTLLFVNVIFSVFKDEKYLTLVAEGKEVKISANNEFMEYCFCVCGFTTRGFGSLLDKTQSSLAADLIDMEKCSSLSELFFNIIKDIQLKLQEILTIDVFYGIKPAEENEDYVQSRLVFDKQFAEVVECTPDSAVLTIYGIAIRRFDECVYGQQITGCGFEYLKEGYLNCNEQMTLSWF